MIKYLISLTLLVAGTSVLAQDVATVVSVQPRYVTVQQKQCTVQEVISQHDGTEGKVIGGLAGGAIGSTIGGNSRDRLVGGVVGALVGGAIGNEVSKGSPTVEQRQVCSIVPVTVQQGRIVTFNYQGMTFSQTFPQ